METIVAALSEEQSELSGLLSRLENLDWERSSRCEGWTVSDVVLHLAQTNELATASVDGRMVEAIETLAGGAAPAGSVDDVVGLMVARERDQPGPAVRARWETSATVLRERLGHCDPHRRVQWVAGELSVRTLAATRLAETWIHGADVAAAFGIVPTPTDRLWHVARLAWRMVPYAFTRAGRDLSGPVAFELRGPDGDNWVFNPEREPATTVRGDGVDLCLVAARRADPADTALRVVGPDPVLELVRTYA